ncbi:MAG: ABC transporter substrate-binding protein [Fervidicoccaceae archaeon]
MKKLKILPMVTVILLLAGIIAPVITSNAQTQNSITLVEFSSTGGLFMSPWNPVLGFTDIYSYQLWIHVREWGLYPAPDTGMPVETTATYQYIGNYTVNPQTGAVVPYLPVPSTALVFDPFTLQWVPISQAAANQTYVSLIKSSGGAPPGFLQTVSNYIDNNGKAPVEIIFNFDQVPWHDGINFSVADVLAWLAFMWRWSTDTSILTNQTDQYYDETFSSQYGPVIGMYEGVQIINDTAIAVYTNYVDVDPSLIAYSVIPYPGVPYDLLAAMEYAVMNSTNLWWQSTTTSRGTMTGIDMLVNAPEIKAAAQALTPSLVYYFNGLSKYGYNYGNDLQKRTSALVAWINAHGNAVVSNGPFYVDQYNAQSNTMVLKSRTFLGLSKIKYHYKNLVVPQLDQIFVESMTTEDAAIQAVKSGTADIFFYSEPINKIGTVPPTVTLIPTTTTYNDLGINPVSNVYDPTAPGTIPLKGFSLNGTVLPGLVLYDPSTVLGIDLSKYGHPDWVPFNLLNLTVMKDPHFQFNPMGIEGVRFALNLLINRNSLVQNIYQGSAVPMLSAIVPGSPAYKAFNISKYEQMVGLYPSGDINAAAALYNQSIASANQTLNKYGFSLKYIPDSTNTPWLTLILPDGTQKTVTIYFEVRGDDPFRKGIGDQVTTWIQQYFHIKVNEEYIQRKTANTNVYGTDLASFSFGSHPWTIYTEGWVANYDEPIYFSRYDVAQMYAPFTYGFQPTPANPKQWYLWNQTIYELGQSLAFGIYPPQQVDKLINDIITLNMMGMQQSLRVFLTQGLQYYMVNGAKVAIPMYGVQTGLGSIWALNTAYVIGATTTTTTPPPPTTTTTTPIPTTTTPTTTPPTTTPTTTPTTPTTAAPSGMSTAELAGLVIVIIIIIAALAYSFMRKK